MGYAYKLAGAQIHKDTFSKTSDGNYDMGAMHKYRYIDFKKSHTAVYSASTNGTIDMGVNHNYRYISNNVYPSNLTRVYFNTFPGNHSTTPASATFNAVNNRIYFIHLRWVSKNNSQGGIGDARVSLGGSAKHWSYTPPTTQSNGRSGGDEYGMAYNVSQCVYVVGNGSNVSVSWYYTMTWGNAAVIEIFQID